MDLNLNKSIILSAGKVNLEETLVKVAEAIQTHNAKHDADLDAVADAVNTVFEEHKGSFVPMTMLAPIALTKLNVPTLDARRDLTERVKNYVAANTEIFFVKKGSGVIRVADLPAPAAK